MNVDGTVPLVPDCPLRGRAAAGKGPSWRPVELQGLGRGRELGKPQDFSETRGFCVFDRPPTPVAADKAKDAVFNDRRY